MIESIADDLYRDIILDHFRSPRNYGRIERADVCVQGSNPLCGDELEIFITLDGAIIKDIKTVAKGCAISCASLSMMTEAIKDKSADTAEYIANSFKALLLSSNSQGLPEGFEELRSLEGVKKYPVRIKCAILCWETLLNGISKIRPHKSGDTQV